MHSSEEEEDEKDTSLWDWTEQTEGDSMFYSNGTLEMERNEKER